ncbi:hypothetical protein HMPREF1154_0229 [Capnocytophaga sp. CM59]|nr:hypothetical protein HMPREF1154_0229 [Capnocytophaga sp. CM59]
MLNKYILLSAIGSLLSLLEKRHFLAVKGKKKKSKKNL